MKTSWVLAALLVAGVGVAWWLGRAERSASEVTDVGPRAAVPRGEGPTLAGAAPKDGVGAQGTYTLRGTVTREGKPAPATLQVEALEGFDWVLEGRRPSGATMFDALVRLEAPAARGPARERHVAAGAFSIDGLARGVYRVRASDAEGRRAMGLAALGAAETGRPLELKLVAHRERLEGVVCWSDGAPVAGRVAVEPASGMRSAGVLEGDSVGSLALDSAGRFVAEGLPAGPLVVRVKTSEGLLAIDRSARLPRSEPWVLTLERPGFNLKGYVVSSVGEVGVSGARILAVHSGGGGEGVFQVTMAQSALDGAFEVGVVGFPAKLNVVADGYAPLEYSARDESPQRIVLSPLGVIVGRVVSARDGAPATGAIVRYEARGSQGQATCGPDGTFRLEGVPPPEALVYVWGGGWVQAPIEGALPSGRKVALAPGGQIDVELEALPSARLEVRVLDAAGAPVPGAQVDLARFGAPGGAGGWIGPRSEVSGTTDAAGSTVLRHVPAETDLWLAVQAERSERVESGPHRAGGAAVEIRLGSARWVEVTVLHADDGSPAAGATVKWIARSGGGHSSSSGPRTDEQGRVRVGPLKGETYFVQVMAGAGLAASEEIPVEVPPGTSGDVALTIRATREALLEGRVLFPDGSPAPRVRLQQGEGDRRTMADLGRPVISNLRGEFRVTGLPPGEHVLSAQHEVEGRIYRGRWTVTAGRRDHELRLEDVSAQWIQLAFEVLDPQGNPVEEASVYLLDGFVSHGSVQILQGRGTMRFQPDSPQAQALAAGRLVPLARGARRRDGTRLPFGPVRGEPLAPAQRDVTLRLVPERTIEGRVLDAAGAPVARVVLEVEPVTMWSGGNPTEPSVETDAQGRFRFGGLGQDPLRLSVRPPEDFLRPQALEVVAGGPALEIRLARGVSARIKVLDPDGRPVAQAQVVMQPALGANRTHEEHLAWGALQRRAQRQVATGADGVALLRGIDPGVSMTLSVTPPSAREDLNGANLSPWTVADTEVRLDAGLEIRGVVRDGDGRPLPDAVVYVADAPNSWTGHPVAVDGTFRLTRLRPGRVALKAVAHRNQRVDPLAPPLATVEAGRQDVVLVLAAPVTLVVQVEGASAAGSQPAVQLLAPFGADGRLYALHVPPERDGSRFTFVGLAPGRVTIWVQPDADGRYGLMQDVATDGGPVRVPRLQGRRITGRVSVPSGAAELRVSAVGADLQVRVDGVIRPDGSYEILGLPPGPWNVDAAARDATGWLQARGEADAGGTLDLTLEASR